MLSKISCLPETETTDNLREEKYRVKEEAGAGFLKQPQPENCIGKSLLQDPFLLWSDIYRLFKCKNKIGRQHGCQMQGRLPTNGDCKGIRALIFFV